MKTEYIYNYLVIPGFLFVIDDSSAETPSWVDTGASDRDGGEVNHEHSKPDGEWCQNLDSGNKEDQ